MKVKELKEAINNLPDDMEVITLGEYSYGKDIYGYEVKKMVYDDTEYDKEKQSQEVLCLKIDHYLVESEDIGYVDVWMNEKEYKDILENNNDDEKDEDEE